MKPAGGCCMIWTMEGGTTPSLSEVLLGRYRLRVRRETEAYLLSRLRGAEAATAAAHASIAVFGGDARTGVPQRALLPARELLDLFPLTAAAAEAAGATA